MRRLKIFEISKFLNHEYLEIPLLPGIPGNLEYSHLNTIQGLPVYDLRVCSVDWNTRTSLQVRSSVWPVKNEKMSRTTIFRIFAICNYL